MSQVDKDGEQAESSKGKGTALKKEGAPEGRDQVLIDLIQGMSAERAAMISLAEKFGDQASRGSSFRLDPPRFDGSGDVEFFLRQFEDVREQEHWSDGQAVLKLRSVLSGSARDCARGVSHADIVGALRTRFGVTHSDARGRLAVLTLDPGASLHTYAGEIDRLTRVAYEGMAGPVLQAAACEKFRNSLGDLPLQRHLLAVGAVTLEGCVRAAEEYRRVAPVKAPASEGVHSVATLEGAAVAAGPVVNRVDAPATEAGLMGLLQRIEERLGRLEAAERPRGASGQVRRGGGPGRQERRGACFSCGETGHFIANCPRLPSPSGTKNKPALN